MVTCLSDSHLSDILCSTEEQRVDEDLQEMKKMEEEEEVLYEEVLLLHRGGVKMEALVAVVTRMFVKYWIYVCGTMFFFVSFEGKIVLYKVIYMVMFLCCVALYQVILQVLLLSVLLLSVLLLSRPQMLILFAQRDVSCRQHCQQHPAGSSHLEKNQRA